MIELYRAIIPASKIINDNHGQHYRIHMGNITWLTRQFECIMNGEWDAPGNFKIPNIESIREYMSNRKYISIRCEVWRCVNRRFDPQNYAKTFKAPIDLLVKNGYIEDDNWKFVNGITYCGGGEEIWRERAVRLEGDGLPDELTPDWWRGVYPETDNYNEVMIRILIE